MSRPPLSDAVAKLASASDDVAQDAFAQIRWKEFRGIAGVKLASELARQLADTEFLPKRTQAVRLRILLSGLRITGPELQDLAVAAQSFPAHLRVTAAEFLPATLRPQIYSERARATDTPESSSVAPGIASIETREARSPVPAVALFSEPEASTIQLMAATAADEVPECSTVLLLSHRAQQVENQKLLSAAPLDPVVIESLGELRQQLRVSKEICACIVDQSFLELLNADDQRLLFQELAGYSSFMRLRVQDAHLRLRHDEIRQIIKQSRGLGSDVPYTAVSFQSESAIRPAEVDDLQHVGTVLRSHQTATFVLGELTQAEKRLLVAAVRARAQAERPDGRIEINWLTMQFLAGGRSGARIATVRVNGSDRIYVAKITQKQFAQDEVGRFRWFVQDWNPTLQPQAYYHGDEAVILFGLVPSDEDWSAPAPMLEDRLADLWNKQWMQQDEAVELDRRADVLGRGLQRASHELARLNASKPCAPGFSCYVNPRTTYLEALEAVRFDWGLNPLLKAARDKAISRFRRLEHAAVVHGDIHLRNMLVRGEGDIQLIDYASSGPGHPALDLARFELALYLGPVRQFEVESQCIAFQRALSIDRAPLDVLKEKFPIFFQCHVNCACAWGMVAARDGGLSAVGRHGGGPSDYLAAKFLVAWQHLGIIGSHTGLARAVLEALAPEINTW